MSNSSFQILKALNTQLKTVVGLPDLVFTEDTSKFDVPSSDDTFITAMDMPTGVDSPVVAGGYEVDTGIYQVSIFTPRGGNAFAAKLLADNVKSAFGRGLLLDAGGSKLRFRKVEAAMGRDSGNHYMIPVSVYWQVVG